MADFGSPIVNEEEQEARALAELRLQAGGQGLRDRWLLEVQRRHSESAVGRRAGNRSGARVRNAVPDRSATVGGGAPSSTRSHLPRSSSGRPRPAPLLVDFSRFQVPAEELDRSGVPTVVAEHLASELQVQWSERAEAARRQVEASVAQRLQPLDSSGTLSRRELQGLRAQAGVADEGLECAVCLQAFSSGQELIRLPCDLRHVLHMACGQRWLCGRSRRCPTCRIAIKRDEPVRRRINSSAKARPH